MGEERKREVQRRIARVWRNNVEIFIFSVRLELYQWTRERDGVKKRETDNDRDLTS